MCTVAPSYAINGKRFRCTLISRISLIVLFFVVLLAGSGHVSASGTYPAKVTLLKNSEYVEELLKGIRNSQNTVLLSYYLFKVTPFGSGLPEKIADELIMARKRGVEVTVILEISDDPNDQLSEENRQTAFTLSRNGIRVFFDSPRRKSHMKTAMIDDRYVYIGSHNLTQSALKFNNEISVLIDSPEMASDVRRYMKTLSVKKWQAEPEYFPEVAR